jgi:diacylglycerol kinase (ATP)
VRWVGPGRLAREAAAAGADLVLAGGGDGTVSEVADGLLRAGTDTALGVLPAGTGLDFATQHGIPRQPAACAQAIAEAPTKRIDAGRVSFVDDDGRPASRHFVSIASVGISGAIDRAVNGLSPRWRRGLPGRALFFLQAQGALMAYRFPEVSIGIDDQPPTSAQIVVCAVAINPTFGGGMRIAPDAKPDDGLFEVVTARATSRLGMVRDLRLVYSGDHRRLDSCSFAAGRRVTIAPVGGAALNAALLDIDGESPGRTPATFEMLEGALTLRGAR